MTEAGRIETPDGPDGLSRRQRRALPVLAAAPTIAAGAKDAGLGLSTVKAWLKQPAFAAALRAAEQDLFRGALGSAQKATGEAVEALRALLSSASEMVRLRAASEILGASLKIREHVALEERMAALEAELARKGKG